MFCVVYQWLVKPGMEEEFRDTWRSITEAIFQQHGSLGSRLHRSDDGSWIAYAQWPDREHWQSHSDTIGIELARSRQSECLAEAVKVLHTLTMTDDSLRSTPFVGLSDSSHVAHFIDGKTKLRVARPTDHLTEVVSFYRDGLGLSQLGCFENHDGFDGVMLGAPNASYHLEFTNCRGHATPPAPTEDNLLVFYLPEQARWHSAVARMQDFGYRAVPSFNPYWDRQGRTFEDPDGYRIVLQNAEWIV